MYCRSVAAPRKGAAAWQQGGGGERGAAINGSPASGGYGPYGIRINCIAPETILTDRNLERIPKDQLASLVDAHPLKRLGTPEDVTQAAVFLASRKAGWITGVVLDVAGGAVMLR